MSASEIKTIFWDVGGVLLTNGWDIDQRKHVLTALGVNLAAYEAVHDEVNFFWERGLISAQDFFERTVLETNPQLGLTFEQLWKLVCDESKMLHPECFAMVANLRRAGIYSLVTLNNESKELNRHRMDTFHFRSFFDYFICSGYIHEMKPLPEIYRAAIDISGFPAETAVFIDDKPENCAAATAFGMNAILFESPAQLRASFAQLGITV